MSIWFMTSSPKNSVMRLRISNWKVGSLKDKIHDTSTKLPQNLILREFRICTANFQFAPYKTQSK